MAKPSPNLSSGSLNGRVYWGNFFKKSCPVFQSSRGHHPLIGGFNPLFCFGNRDFLHLRRQAFGRQCPETDRKDRYVQNGEKRACREGKEVGEAKAGERRGERDYPSGCRRETITSLPKKRRIVEQEAFEFLEPSKAFQLPPISLLEAEIEKRQKIDRDSLIMNSRILEKKLLDYGVEGKVVEVRPGPVITVYEFEPAPGVKVSRIVNLADDLALALSALSIRIVAPIPGKAVVGIEVPNTNRETVFLKEIIDSDPFRASKSKLSFGLGKDISGEPFVVDLGQNAPSPGRRINRVWQERFHQFDDLQHSLQSNSGRGPIPHDRPEDAGTLRLRRHPSFASSCRHQSQEGSRGPQMVGGGDGAEVYGLS